MEYYIEHQGRFFTPSGQIDKPGHTNQDISAAELEYWQTRPTRHFVYINEKNKTATTWMGDVLGRVCFGRPYRDNFGATRVPIDVRGNNGVSYYGTYYQSTGSYARIYARKHQEA